MQLNLLFEECPVDSSHNLEQRGSCQETQGDGASHGDGGVAGCCGQGGFVGDESSHGAVHSRPRNDGHDPRNTEDHDGVFEYTGSDLGQEGHQEGAEEGCEGIPVTNFHSN